MYRSFRNLIFILFVALTFGSAYGQSSPVILTVFGKFEHSNRGAIDKFNDGFLNHHEMEFDKAFEFDLASLTSMEQIKLTVNAEGWEKPVTLSGPKLSQVLEAAGYQGKMIMLTALDGYAVELTQDEIKAKDWVLALSMNGKILSLGGRGPLWLVHDVKGKKATSDEEGKWIWSVFSIKAE